MICEFKRSGRPADSGSMRSVTGLCIGVGTIVGGFVPDLWGASGFSLAAVVTSALGGVAGLWFGVKLAA